MDDALIREQRKQGWELLIADLKRKRERAELLEAESERRWRGFWSKLFGGSV